jgi:aspartyl-tRNA(Asn)/glutamyl-tRNA(Gln) amidotransferase subunit A
MSSSEPALLSLTEVADAIAQKKISSREATQSCLDRVAKFQPSLNAYMSIETATARCMACRWRTRTCITTRATS